MFPLAFLTLPCALRYRMFAHEANPLRDKGNGVVDWTPYRDRKTYGGMYYKAWPAPGQPPWPEGSKHRQRQWISSCGSHGNAHSLCAAFCRDPK